MTSILSALSRFLTPAVLALLLADASLAQAPDASKRRPPAPRSKQQTNVQASADKSATDVDRKFREMDRRLKHTLRGICAGC